jgi:cobalamin biosynthesis protein CobD/CbiB
VEVEEKMLGGLPSPHTDRAVETLLKVLSMWKAAAQDLGEFPSRLQPCANLVASQQSIQQVVISEEELRRLARTLDVARRIAEQDAGA